MKTLLRFLVSVAATCFLVGMAAPVVAEATGMTETAANCIAVSLIVGFAVLSRFQKPTTAVKNGLEVEFWVNYIIDRLWADNAFLRCAYDDDQYVIGGKIVHIPQPGAKPTVTKNRNSFPATAVRRTDTEVLYPLDEYSTDPTHIQNADTIQLSYNKIDSVLRDHTDTLNDTIASDILIKWFSALPGANLIGTGGASTAALETGQTGNRLALVHTDLKKCRTKMNKGNVPQNDRYALLEENMLDQMVDSLSTTQYKDFSQYYDATTGTIGKLYGFNIMSRSSVVTAANALSSGNLAVNALGAATGATDNVVSLVWQKNSLARALGSVQFFENLNDALYQGDVYSALLYMGGRRRRADNAGVIGLVQTAA